MVKPFSVSALSLLFLVLYSSTLLIAPAAAGNVTLTFSDLDLDKSTRILIYDPAADPSFVGEYNTTDTVHLVGGDAYILTFKPSEQVWFQNPLNMLELIRISIPVWLSAAMLLFTVLCGLMIFVWVFMRRR